MNRSHDGRPPPEGEPSPAPPVRLSRALVQVLRQRGPIVDAAGWASCSDLVVVITATFELEITVEMVSSLVRSPAGLGFEHEGERVRLAHPAEISEPRDARRVQPPDILYHATNVENVDRVQRIGMLTAGDDRPVFLSSDEAHAWRVAHRLGGEPAVLVVDTARARRRGSRFWRNRRSGLYLSSPVALLDLLNLQPNYAEQVSAGGIPVIWTDDGPQLALIRVSRKSGATWEVAKGKLEIGEAPEQAAIREVREEMGIDVDLRITRALGALRYGFLAPGSLPRLKTVHMYLMSPLGPIPGFRPASGEGIGAVKWFGVEEARAAISHSSLVPVMRRAVELLAPGGPMHAGPLPPETP